MGRVLLWLALLAPLAVQLVRYAGETIHYGEFLGWWNELSDAVRERFASDYAKGYVTIGDIVQQLSAAYSVAWDNEEPGDG